MGKINVDYVIRVAQLASDACSPQAIFNPLQGFFNAMAYGGLCHSAWGWLSRKLHPSEDPYVSSWSGEYIDVDFRVNRGKIHQSKRSQIKTPPERVESVE